MEYLVLPGEAAYTESVALKIQDRINKSGIKVEKVSAVFLHYAHLKDSTREGANVSLHVHISLQLPDIPHLYACSTNSRTHIYQLSLH